MNLTFGNGAILWGTLLFAVPLIIHLLNRRRFRVLRWAAQEFLLQAWQKTRRRLTFESLLLLLLRCLLVAACAFALARPFVPSSSPLGKLTRSQRNVVLVVDSSFSMATTDQSGDSPLTRLKLQARRVLDALSEKSGDQVTILTLGDPPRVLQSQTSDLTRARDVVDRLSTTWSGADLTRTLDLLVEQVLAPGVGHREVYVFSDLQRVTFSGATDATGESGTEPASPVAPSGRESPAASAWRRAAAFDAEFAVIDVGQARAPNDLAVEDIRIRPENAIAGEAIELLATVKNHGSRDRRGITGTFTWNGRRDQSRTVTFDVGPNASAIVQCMMLPPEGGAAGVEFALEPDELTQNDKRWIAFPVHSAVKTLLVDGDADKGADLSETAVIAPILNPAPDPENSGTVYRLHTVDDRRFNLRGETLADYDLIVLANVARVDPQVAEELENAVKAGRGLLIFLGDLVDPTSWNERFHRADGTGLLPARIVDTRGDTRPDADLAFSSAIDAPSHRVLKLFADPIVGAQLKKSRLRALWRVEVGPLDTATSVLMHADDDAASPSPLLLDKPLGDGRVLLWTSSADAAWNDFASQDHVVTFLPLMQEAAAYLTLPDLKRFNLAIGERIRRSTRSIPQEIAVVMPSTERVRMTETPREMEYGEFVLPAFDRTSEPGLYQLEMTFPLAAGSDAGSKKVEQYAVNVDPRESDPARVEIPAFAQLFPGVTLGFSTEVRSADRSDTGSRGGELFHALLMALIGLLAAEMVLAWLFGRARSGGGA